MVSGFLGKEVPVYRLRVRISCYPLRLKNKSVGPALDQLAFFAVSFFISFFEPLETALVLAFGPALPESVAYNPFSFWFR